MRFNLRRLSAVTAGLSVLAIGIVASATAATPGVTPSSLPQVSTAAPFLKTLPTRMTVPTTRPAVAPGIRAAKPPFRAGLDKNTQLANLAISRGLEKAASSLAPDSISPEAFLGCFEYNAFYYRCIYSFVFTSGGYEWVQHYHYFYRYGGPAGWSFYGINQWWGYIDGYSAPWYYNGWYCCYYP